MNNNNLKTIAIIGAGVITGAVVVTKVIKTIKTRKESKENSAK